MSRMQRLRELGRKRGNWDLTLSCSPLFLIAQSSQPVPGWLDLVRVDERLKFGKGGRQREECIMSGTKFLGLLIGASLLFGFEPIAEATPMAAPPRVVEMSAFSGNVAQAFLGIERRHARRVERRARRHERREARRIYRHERRERRRAR